MSLQGKIESIFLSSILQLLCNDKKTGSLRVWKDEVEVTIYLNEGTIIYAKSSEKKHHLGYLLRSTALITTDNLKKCLKLTQDKHQTLGKTLVEEGLISIENLKKFLRKKVRHTLYSLFLWKKGFFEFQDKKLNLEGHIIIELNTMELILEASRRADEKAVLEKKLYGEKQVLEQEKREAEKTLIILPPND